MNSLVINLGPITVVTQNQPPTLWPNLGGDFTISNGTPINVNLRIKSPRKLKPQEIKFLQSLLVSVDMICLSALVEGSSEGLITFRLAASVGSGSVL
jgi:hypothetical protein